MNKKIKKYLSVILVITILLSGVILVTKNTFFKNFFVSAIVFLAGSVVYLICIYLFGLLPKGKHKARREGS